MALSKQPLAVTIMGSVTAVLEHCSSSLGFSGSTASYEVG
jgi:hypothetical protein